MEREQYQCKAGWARERLAGKEWILKSCTDVDKQQGAEAREHKKYNNRDDMKETTDTRL